jgi:C-terminal processing protease CtpA/Prc
MRLLIPSLALVLGLVGTLHAAPTGKPYLGMIGANPSDQGAPAGALVVEVSPESPAAQAGLAVGDRIVELNGEPIANFDDLKSKVGQMHPKDQLQLKVMRGEEEKSLAVELGEAAQKGDAGQTQRRLLDRLRENLPGEVDPNGGPTMDPGRLQEELEEMFRPRPMVGIQVQEIDAELREHLQLGEVQGVVVADVVPGSPAEKADVQSEDVVTAADGQPIRSPADLQKLIQSKKKGETVTLRLRRAGQDLEKVVEVDERSSRPGPLGWRLPNAQILEERLEGISKRLGELEQRMEQRAQETAESLRARSKSIENEVEQGAAARIDLLEKRLAEFEKRAEQATSQAVEKLEARVAELTKRLEELTLPKEPVK